MIKIFFKKMEIDNHVAYSLILRLWSIIAGAFLVVLIPYSLTKAQQGFYFTFSSLLAAQVFFELGLNSVLNQIVGHESAHLNFNVDGKLEGPEINVSRLNSLFRLIRKVYKWMAILFFFSIFIGGYVFFNTQSVDNGNEWKRVWPILTLVTAINLYLSPFLSSLEGMGLVAKVSKLRLCQSIAGYLILWISLLLGVGLMSMIAIPFLAALFSSAWIFKNYKDLFFNNKYINSTNAISWQKEVFPFQWRIALSWLSGYFIFQLYNPVVFSRFGAEAAGKVGLALTIYTTIGAFSFSWVSAKLPVMTQFIALSKKTELHTLFWKVLTRSSILNLSCCIAFVIIVQLAKVYGFKIADRVPDLSILIMLSVVSFVNNFIFSAASYMRAYKKEPMLMNSICVAVLSVFGIYVGALYSVFSIFLIYMLIVVIVSLPWTIFLFKKFYYQEEKI